MSRRHSPKARLAHIAGADAGQPLAIAGTSGSTPMQQAARVHLHSLRQSPLRQFRLQRNEKRRHRGYARLRPGVFFFDAEIIVLKHSRLA